MTYPYANLLGSLSNILFCIQGIGIELHHLFRRKTYTRNLRLGTKKLNLHACQHNALMYVFSIYCKVRWQEFALYRCLLLLFHTYHQGILKGIYFN